jgi:hypothetical protein
VRFAVKVVREHGHVTEDDINAVKSAGYDDAQVIEIVLHVALNTWTNYINAVAKTDIAFPSSPPARRPDGPRSRQDTLAAPRAIASEVDTGSRQENAIK